METAILLSTIGSTVMSAGKAFMGAQQEAAQQNTEAQVASYNAQIARQNASIAANVGASQEAQSRRGSAMEEGRAFAAVSQSGVGVTSGSAQDVLRQQAINDQLDALNIRYEGQLNARGYADRANQYAIQSQIYRSNSSNAKMGGYFGAASALLSGSADYFTRQGFGAGGSGSNPLSGFGQGGFNL